MSIPPGQPPQPSDPNWQSQSPQPPPPPGTPGYGGGGGPGGPDIPNYLVWSILTTIFCCLPFGIVSIVHAAKVDGKKAAGDIQGAMEASRKAKTWAITAAGAGVIGVVLYFLFVFLVIGGSFFAGFQDF